MTGKKARVRVDRTPSLDAIKIFGSNLAARFLQIMIFLDAMSTIAPLAFDIYSKIKSGISKKNFAFNIRTTPDVRYQIVAALG